MQVGNSIDAGNSSWTFSGDVAKSFEKHIISSVPHYEDGHTLIANLSDFFVQSDSVFYELGCSTGKLSNAVAARCGDQRGRFIGIDSVPEMISVAKETYVRKNLSFYVADVLDYEFEKADMVASYYLLQFIKPKFRQQVVDRIYDTLNWGGAFVCFEKVRAPDARFQDIYTALYNEFKLEKGFTPDEIFGKARSLKGVLEPFSSEGNLEMFRRAGFVDITTIFKHISFEGFLMVK